MRLLFVTEDIQWPLRLGAHIRKWHILQGLLKVGDVDVVIYSQNDTRQRSTAFSGCNAVFRVPPECWRNSRQQTFLHQSTLGRGLLTLSSILPFEYRSAAIKKLRSMIRAEIDVSSYVLIWFERARAAMLFGPVRALPTILDGDDFAYVRKFGLARSTPWFGAKIWDYIDVAKLWLWERSFAKRFTLVLRCSENDRDRHPAPNVVVLPNGASVPALVRRQPERRLLFVGYLGYPPNALGVGWFLREVWPGIHQRFPDAGLDIVGFKPPGAISRVHGTLGVCVHGFVEDLTQFYERACTSIVPLFAGSGTRLKILESLGRAVPVVSTTLGAYGIDIGEAQGLMRADDPQSFAQKCMALLQNSAHGAQVCASAGREVIIQRFDWQIIQHEVGRLVERAVATFPRKRDVV